MRLAELDEIAQAFGRAMAERGYPGFSLHPYVFRPEDTNKSEHETLTRGGRVHWTFYGPTDK